MPVVASRDGEKQGLLRAAELMMVSSRTAPKSGGVDDVDTVLVTGSEKDKIAVEMDKMGDERKIDGFRRDADNVKRSEALLLVGVNGRKNLGLSCGACGHSTCEEFNRAAAVRGVDFEGPSCVFKALDLGIALGSAVKTAWRPERRQQNHVSGWDRCETFGVSFHIKCRDGCPHLRFWEEHLLRQEMAQVDTRVPAKFTSYLNLWLGCCAGAGQTIPQPWVV